MPRIQIMRSRSVIILLTYLMLILAPPIIRETCCTKDHHGNDHGASVIGQITLLHTISHPPYDGTHEKRSLTSRTSEKEWIYDSQCCSARHHHHFSGCDCSMRVALLRHSSNGESARSSLSIARASANVATATADRMPCNSIRADMPATISLHSTVLLI